GDPMGGGNTGALGCFCLLVMLIKLSEFRHDLISRRSVVLHILVAFAICVLAEVKFVILLSPLLLAWVWLSPSYVSGMKSYDLKHLLLIALAMAALVAVAVLVLAASYSSAFAGAGQQGALALFVDSLGYIFDPNHINPKTGELGRVTTLFFWASNGDYHGFSNLMFGYGLNTTNHGSTLPGFLNPLFNVLLDSTALSILLWEVGLVGTLLFIVLIVMLLWYSRPRPLLDRQQLSRADIRLLSYQPAFIAFGIAGLLSLPYSQLLMLIPAQQFIFYFVLGAALVIRSSVLQATRSCEVL
ncbi:MAG: capsular biosynthesis protein, partial [Plesiomonas shigelloides]